MLDELIEQQVSLSSYDRYIYVCGQGLEQRFAQRHTIKQSHRSIVLLTVFVRVAIINIEMRHYAHVLRRT